MRKKDVDFNKMIWEGWTVKDFIEDLLPVADRIMNGEAITKPFKDKKELERWLTDNQPYYKKRIPDVCKFFSQRYGL